MEVSKQKYLVETIISSPEVFSLCSGIIKPEFFDGDLRRVVSFVIKYFDEYKALPDLDVLTAEFNDVKLNKTKITRDKIEYSCNEILKHCIESAVAIAMEASLGDLQSGNFGAIVERMQDAVGISLKRDLGWQFFDDNFIQRLDEALEQQATTPTGIGCLDKYLNGGLSRQQVTLFTANSGVGKSIMLNNLSYNYAAMGYNSVLLSLELPRPMLFTRTTGIVSGYSVSDLGENRIEVASSIQNISSKVGGTLLMERIAGDSNTNDIRSYITQYEMELGYTPDALFVDYLDKMTPNQGVGRLSVSEQDKAKSEQLAELVFDYNMFCASASQQNRDAIGNAAPRQDVIAGGYTKINTVDNVISLYMDEQMRLRGEMIAHFLKTRSSSGVGKSTELHFDTNNLRITDPSSASNRGLFDIQKKRDRLVDDVIKHLPGINENDILEDYEFAPENDKGRVDEEIIDINKPQSDLINFMEELRNG